jgi:hypothetical protein
MVSVRVGVEVVGRRSVAEARWCQSLADSSWVENLE